MKYKYGGVLPPGAGNQCENCGHQASINDNEDDINRGITDRGQRDSAGKSNRAQTADGTRGSADRNRGSAYETGTFVQNQIYVPANSDKIDRVLADFINKNPRKSKLKVLFMRESEGVYKFGSKRVYVKVDRGTIQIRVGGGYLSIDEFLD